MNPGMSARKTSGILKASQREAKAAIFRQLSGKRIPPLLCRVVGNNAQHVSLNPGKGGDDLACVESPVFEKGSFIDERVDDIVHVERKIGIHRDDILEPGIIRAREMRGSPGRRL
jgi:hypothetical protein